jgi:heme/copper-type cytochrome/quinol oxidase subunit 2
MLSLITHPHGLQAIIEAIFISFVTFHLSWMVFFPLIFLFVFVSIARLYCFLVGRFRKGANRQELRYQNPKTIFITGVSNSEGMLPFQIPFCI